MPKLKQSLVNPNRIMIPDLDQGKAPKRVELIWADASYDSRTFFPGDRFSQGVLLTSIGYIVGETKDFITIAGEYKNYEGSSFRHMISIPQIAILKRRELK